MSQRMSKVQYSMAHGFRLLSSYRTDAGEKLWIITEADRSATTLLLPEEYRRVARFGSSSDFGPRRLLRRDGGFIEGKMLAVKDEAMTRNIVDLEELVLKCQSVQSRA